MTPSDATLRDRLRLLEGEVDNLRGSVRFLHQQERSEPAGLDESLLERIARLEAQTAEQAHTVQQFIAAVARTDHNLQRLAVELERLLARQAAPVIAPSFAIDVPPPIEVNPFPPAPAPELEAFEDDEDDAPRHGWKASVVVIAVLVLAIIAGALVIRQARRGSANEASATSVFSPMERARMFENEKKYQDAESIYRDILKRDPHNAEAIRQLASVLFRQNKIEESSVVLKQLVASGSNE